MSFEVDVLPVNTKLPGDYIGYDTRAALRGVQISPKFMCIVSLMTEGGGAEKGEVYDVTSERRAIALFGAGSPAHIAYRNALATYPYGNYRVVALEEGTTAGTAASGSVKFDGTATSGGHITLVAGQESVRVPVRIGDTAAQVAAAIKAALGDLTALEVSVLLSGDEITLTALCAGEYGNTIGIEAIVEDVQGISVAAAKMKDGSDGSYELSSALENISGFKNDIVVFPFDWKNTKEGSGDFADIVKYIDKVSSPIEKNPAICIIGKIGEIDSNNVGITSSTASGWVELPDHPRFCFVNLIGTNAGIHSVLSSFGATVLQYVDPALPINDIVLPTIKPASRTSDYLRGDMDALLSKGVCPLQITSARQVATVRLISTETTSEVSRRVPDMWIRSLDYAAETIRFVVGRATRGQKNTERMVGAVRAVILSALLDLQEREIVKNVLENKSRLVVERNTDNIGFFNVKIPLDVVLGLHGTMGHIELIIS